jgi:hypothetical protein
MRRLADADRIRALMRALGEAASSPAQVYLAGGASAVLLGWRATTVDVDLKIVPDQDRVLRAIAALKDLLEINVELATPDDFIPVAPQWPERSPFIAQEGLLTFRHFDLTAQALAKIERGHAQDLIDVDEMLARGLVTPAQLEADFAAAASSWHRYPAVDPPSFRRALDAALAPGRRR